MAEHLFEQNYVHPAASLGGAVLEDGLRKMACNSGITVTSRDDLNSLRDKCFQKQVIDRLALKEIDAWGTIRNSADHGKFDEYDARQVRGMLDGVRSFLGKHLG